MCNKEIATQHKAPTVTLSQTKGFGNSQIGRYNHESMLMRKLICTFCERIKLFTPTEQLNFICLSSGALGRVGGTGRCRIVLLSASILSWCNVNLRQCGGILRMPSNTFPPFLFEHKATNTHLNTPYFTTFGSKLRCKRWEILALRQNSQAKVASVAFSILYLVLH